MSVFPHMHLLGKDLICYAVTPSNDTINLIKINNWNFEWQIWENIWPGFMMLKNRSICSKLGIWPRGHNMPPP